LRRKEWVMLKQLIFVWVVTAVAIAVAAALVPSVDLDGGVGTLLWVALLFGLVNGLIGPLLHLISLPLTLITFGLFGLVVNGALLALTAGLSDSLDVGGFLATIVAAVVISVIEAVLGFVGARLFAEPSVQNA
jgi:putative membrane protein